MRFLYNAPAIMHRGALIVGDTHFGMEAKLRSRGIFDDSFSAMLFEKLKGTVIEHKAKQVIFLGDVKEDIMGTDSKTRRILEELSDLCKIKIAKGNHDGGIDLVPDVEVMPAEGFVFGNLGLLHGHSWPAKELMRCRFLVMGHQHPMIRITESSGRKHSEPVWIFADADEKKMSAHYEKFNEKIRLVLLPAFNPLVGFPINLSREDALGPILNKKLFKLECALVFRLDGTCLGMLKEITNQKG